MPVANSEKLLRIKEEILRLWEALPPEHHATMLLVLLEKSEAGDWVAQAHLLRKEQKGETLKPPPW